MDAAAAVADPAVMRRLPSYVSVRDRLFEQTARLFALAQDEALAAIIEVRVCPWSCLSGGALEQRSGRGPVATVPGKGHVLLTVARRAWVGRSGRWCGARLVCAVLGSRQPRRDDH